METEKRRREAEPENQYTIHDDDDAEEDEEISDVIRVREVHQMRESPLFVPAIRMSPQIRVRSRLRGSPAKVVVPRQTKRSSRPPSKEISSSHRDQAAQTVKARKVFRLIQPDTDESNEGSEVGLEGNELEEEDEGQHEDSDAEMEASSTRRSNVPDRLWGHQATLDKIFSTVEEYREARKESYNNEYRSKKEVIKEICDLCDDTASRYMDLQTTSSFSGLSEPDENQVEQSLPDILRLVNELDPDDEDNGEDNDKDDHSITATQVYLYVFPALVDLLKAAAEYHCSIIASDDPRAMLGIPGLDSLDKIFRIIETLDRHSKSWKAKPKASGKLHVVRDMRNDVITKLKKIAEDLREHAEFQRIHADNIHKQKLEAEAARRQYELEQRQEAERLVMKEKMARLGNLYFERLKLEPDIYRQPKLRVPKFGHRNPELDANGEPFERISMFQERNGSHIPHGWEDAEQEWQDCENEAIIDGLKTYYGMCTELPTSWYHLWQSFY
jgi:hypothetical protein